jgi:NAD(P)-dependent dehydrogenase (short-subunit alcohol dehydrogenase family)
MPTYDLNGKVALVTGAARGIGFETARQMHMRGASVAVVDLDAAEAREAAERIGARAIGIAADVTDAGAIQAAVAETVERFGGLDVAVANAGVAPPKIATVRGSSSEEWERVFEVDMLGVWRTVRAALPQIVERQGQIVITSSVYAFANGIFNSAYASAKAGVEALGRTLRAELAPLGASASVAYFGFVDTKLVQDAFELRNSERLQENMPAFLRKRITPDEAGAAMVRGIEEKAPRIFAPKWWRYASALRGVLSPFLDWRFERDAKMIAAVRDIEAEADEQGAAAVASADRLAT